MSVVKDTMLLVDEVINKQLALQELSITDKYRYVAIIQLFKARSILVEHLKRIEIKLS